MTTDKDFMTIVRNISKHSEDPDTKVGACIVRNGEVLGKGYNSWPRGCQFSWTNDKEYCVCHAELNAILSSNLSELRDSIMYVSLHPCNECAKMIIQSGIKTVVYDSNVKNHKRKYTAAAAMFEAAKIECRQYVES